MSHCNDHPAHPEGLTSIVGAPATQIRRNDVAASKAAASLAMYLLGLFFAVPLGAPFTHTVHPY